MLKSFLLVTMTTVALFYWFVVAFFSGDNFEWYTSQFVQEVTGVGTVIGIAATMGIVVVAIRRWVRRTLGHSQ